MFFWGQAKYDWSSADAAVYLAVFTISPGVGALIGSRLLYPSQLRYAKSIALMLFSAAVGCVLEGLASPTVASAIGLSILATAGGGVYPAILALLTPDVAPGGKGICRARCTRSRRLGPWRHWAFIWPCSTRRKPS